MLQRLFYILPLLSPILGQTSNSWPADSIQSFKIQAPYLNLKFQQSSSSAYSIEAKDLLIKNTKGELLIQSKEFFKPSPQSKNTVQLKISGPSKPVSVFTKDSRLNFSGWKSPVAISSLKGQLTSLNTSGNWILGLKSGSINMKKHKGEIRLKSFEMKALVENSSGAFNFQLNEGHLKLEKSQGSAELTGDQADIQFSNFKGDIKAFSQSGAIKGSLKPGQVEVKTKTGNINLNTMGQGSYVTAYTERGKIYAPKYFNKKFEGKSTRAKGRILSKTKKGNVLIESERGNISIW